MIKIASATVNKVKELQEELIALEKSSEDFKAQIQAAYNKITAFSKDIKDMDNHTYQKYSEVIMPVVQEIGPWDMIENKVQLILVEFSSATKELQSDLDQMNTKFFKHVLVEDKEI